MSDGPTGQRWVSTDYRECDGVIVHKRWLNEDGTRKAGIELEREQLKAELEDIASRLLAFSKRV